MKEVQNMDARSQGQDIKSRRALVAAIGVGILFWVSLALILFWALRH